MGSHHIFTAASGPIGFLGLTSHHLLSSFPLLRPARSAGFLSSSVYRTLWSSNNALGSLRQRRIRKRQTRDKVISAFPWYRRRKSAPCTSHALLVGPPDGPYAAGPEHPRWALKRGHYPPIKASWDGYGLLDCWVKLGPFFVNQKLRRFLVAILLCCLP